MHVGTDFLKLPPVTGQYWSLFQCSMLGTGGTCEAATRRNVRREERVTIQGPVKEQQPDGMSHRGGGGAISPGERSVDEI